MTLSHESSVAQISGSMSPGSFTDAETLPPHCYTSADFAEFELRAIFRREWICVGRLDQIPEVGDFYTINIGNDPFIVTRAEPDQVNVISAVCRHRSMILAEGCGHGRGRFVCPYHAWTYDGEGSLLSAPAMTRTSEFDKTAISLPKLRVELWQGFIFANYLAEPASLACRLDELTPLLVGYDLQGLTGLPADSMEMACNWKVALENAMECYHCSVLHRGYHDCAPSRNILPEPFPDSDASLVMRIKATVLDPAFTPPSFTAFFPAMPGLSEDQRRHMMWIAVLPNLVLSFGSDNVHYLIYLPDGTDRVAIRFGWMYPASTIAQPNFDELRQQQAEIYQPLLEQDVFVCETLQKGLRSSLAVRGRLSWQEETIAHFNRWLAARYEWGVAAGLDRGF